MTPTIADWHSPRNEDCKQNENPEQNCTCRKPKKVRKPYRVIRVHDPEVTMHKVRKDLIVELHPNGRLLIREKARPRSTALMTTVGTVYERLIWRTMMIAAKAKKKARAKR